MEIIKAQSGDVLNVKVNGRLDGYWADDLRRDLLECVREGAHHILLDASAIDYMSSIGLGALLEVHQHLAKIQGTFFIVNPSKTVHKLLHLSGIDHLLMTEAPVVTPVVASAAAPCRSLERENYLVDVFDCAPQGKLQCRTIGNPDLLQGPGYREEHCSTISLPDSTMAIGLGALGDGFEECKNRFGEFLAAAGAVAYQPTDGSGVADHMASTGTFIPSLQMLYGILCEGSFAYAAHFQKKKESRSITISDLTAAAFEITGSDAVGMLMVAESAGLLGAWLRKSPVSIAGDSSANSRFSYPYIRNWLSFAAERTFHRSMVIVSGVAVKSEQAFLKPYIRPLWSDPFPAGHFHGASFSYRPLQKGETDLKKVVTTLFAEEDLQGVLHLLSDDRDAEGTGQSEFVRGVCWISPIVNPESGEKS